MWLLWIALLLVNVINTKIIHFGARYVALSLSLAIIYDTCMRVCVCVRARVRAGAGRWQTMLAGIYFGVLAFVPLIRTKHVCFDSMLSLPFSAQCNKNWSSQIDNAMTTNQCVVVAIHICIEICMCLFPLHFTHSLRKLLSKEAQYLSCSSITTTTPFKQ